MKMAVFNPASLRAEEFINDEEIQATLAYAEENKNNISYMDLQNGAIFRGGEGGVYFYKGRKIQQSFLKHY